MRARTIGILAGVVLVLLLVASLAGIAWVLYTESGRDRVLAMAEAHLPEGSRLIARDGVLAGPLTLVDSRLVLPEADVRVKRLELDWSPAALLRGQVHVVELSIAGVDLELPAAEAAEPAGVLELPESITLPVTLQIDSLVLREVNVVFPDQADYGPFALELDGRFDEVGLALDRLAVSTPWGEAAGWITLGATRPHVMNATFDWRAAGTEMTPELRGALQLGGNLQELDLTLQVDAPETVELSGTVRPLAGPPNWDLVLQAAAMTPGSWWSEAPPEIETLALDLRLQGDPAATRIRGRVGAGIEALESWNAGLDLELAPDRLVLDELRLRGDMLQGEVRARGDIAWPGDEPEFDLRANWADLAWPAGEPDFTSADGQLHLHGTPEAWRLEMNAEGGVPEWPSGRVRLAGEGDTDSLRIESLGAEWMEATWLASGHMEWSETFRGDVELQVAGLDPALSGLPLQGRVDLAMFARWQMMDDGLNADVRLDRVDGNVGGQPLTGRGRVLVAGARIDVDELRLQAGDAELEVDGTVLPEPRLTFITRVPELAAILPDARGSVDASGRISGPLLQPSIRLRLDTERLAWADTFSLRQARIRADIPTEPGESVQLDVQAADLGVGAAHLERVTATLGGTVDDHVLHARIDSHAGSVDARVAGGLLDEQWDGHVEQLELAPDGLPPWRLDGRTAVLWTPVTLRLDRLCVRPDDDAGNDASLCVDGEAVVEQGWEMALDMKGLPVAMPVAFLLRDFDAAGTLDMDLRAGAESGAPSRFRMDAMLSEGALAHVGDDDDPIELIAWNESRFRAEGGLAYVRAELDMPLRPEGNVQARIEVGRDPDSPLRGRLELDSERLALLGRFVPEVGRVEGRLRALMEVEGTRMHPRFEGTIDLADGRITLPRPGLVLEDVSLDLGGHNSRIEGRVGARSGEGRVEIDARAQRLSEGWVVDGAIRGENVLVLATPDGRVVVTPELEWLARNRNLRLEGVVAVPQAAIHPRDYTGAVRPSADVEIVRSAIALADEEAPVEDWTVNADIRVALGDAVTFRGFGLRGRLDGALDIRERPGELPTATGELEVIDGTYRAYAQELTIEHGRLIYDGGPVVDPGLDVRAVRRPRGVMVGVTVRGTLQAPDVTVFSEPDMPQSHQLSYLILGIPPREADSDDQGAMRAAIAGAGWVTEQVGEQIAIIDDLALEEGATPEETELVVGTWLSPRLYVSYGMGVLETFSRMRMRYLLDERWSVEAQSGPTSSTDLIYTIER